MVTPDDVFQAAWELVSDDHKPDIRVALIAAILSAQKPVEDNAAQLDAIRDYILFGFPTRDPQEVYRMLEPYGMVSAAQARGILAVMAAWHAGELDHLTREPTCLLEWAAWRREVAHMYCLSWKTASFAALLMWPLSSPLVPVDQHVCGRLGEMRVYHSGLLSKKTRRGYAEYRRIERKVWREWQASEEKMPTLGLHHWLTWERWRQVTGASKACGGAQSHAGLRAW